MKTNIQLYELPNNRILNQNHQMLNGNSRLLTDHHPQDIFSVNSKSNSMKSKTKFFTIVLWLIFLTAKSQASITVTNLSNPSRQLSSCQRDSFQFSISGFSPGDTLNIRLLLPAGMQLDSTIIINNGTLNILFIDDTSALVQVTNASDSLIFTYSITGDCESFDVDPRYLQNSIEAWVNQDTAHFFLNQSYNLNTPFISFLNESSKNIDNDTAEYLVNYQREFVFKNTGSVAFNGNFLFNDTSVNDFISTALVIKAFSIVPFNSTVISLTDSIVNDTTLYLRGSIFNLAIGDSFIIIETVKAIRCIPDVSKKYSSAYQMNFKYGCSFENVNDCKQFPNLTASTFALTPGNIALAWNYVDPVTLDTLPHNEIPYNCPKNSTTFVIRFINTGTQTADTIRIFQGLGYYPGSITFFDSADVRLFERDSTGINYISPFSTNAYSPDPSEQAYFTDFHDPDSLPVYFQQVQDTFYFPFAPGDTLYAEFTIRNICVDSIPDVFAGGGIFRTPLNILAYNQCNKAVAPYDGNYVNPGNFYNFTQQFLPTKVAFDGRPSVQEEAWMKIEGTNLHFENDLGLDGHNARAYGSPSVIVSDPDKFLLRIRFNPSPGFSVNRDSVYLALHKGGVPDTILYPVKTEEVFPNAGDTCNKYLWADFQLPSQIFRKIVYPNGDTSLYYQLNTASSERYDLWLNNADVHFKLKSNCLCKTFEETFLEENAFFVVDSNCAQECLVPLASVNKKLVITCPGCLLPGWDLGGSLTIQRVNFGKQDNDNDNHPDMLPVQGADLNFAHIERATHGDTIELQFNGLLYPGNSINIDNIGFPFKYSYARIRFKGDSAVASLQFAGGDGIYMVGTDSFSFAIPDTNGYGNDVDLSLGKYPALVALLGRDSMRGGDKISLKLRFRLKDNIISPDYIAVQTVIAEMDISGVAFFPTDSSTGNAGTDPSVIDTMPVSERQKKFYWCTAAAGGFVSVGYSHVIAFRIGDDGGITGTGAGYDNRCINYGNCYKSMYFASSLDFGQANMLGRGNSLSREATSLFAFPVHNQPALNAFSFEVREFMLLDSITVVFPAAYYELDTIRIYEANMFGDTVSFQTASTFRPYIYDCNTVFTYPIQEATVYNDSTVSIYPSRFYQYYLKPGYLLQEPDSLDFGDESRRIALEFVFKMKNYSATPDSIDMTNYPMTVSLKNMPGRNTDTVLVDNFNFFNDYRFEHFYTPKPLLEARGVPDLINNVSTSTVSWNAEVVNKFVNRHLWDLGRSEASNTFVTTFSPSGNITVDTIIVNALTAAKLNPSFHKAGEINGNALYGFGTTAPTYCDSLCDNIYGISIGAHFDCSAINKKDSIGLIFGWNCYGYPTSLDPDSVCFVDTIYLYLSPADAGLNATLQRTPDPVGVCDIVKYTTTIFATGTGKIDTLSVQVLTCDSNYIQGSGKIIFPNFTVNLPPQILNDTLTWNMTPFISGGIAHPDSVTLSFKIRNLCFANNPVSLNIRGVNFCGKDTSLTLQDTMLPLCIIQPDLWMADHAPCESVGYPACGYYKPISSCANSDSTSYDPDKGLEPSQCSQCVSSSFYLYQCVWLSPDIWNRQDNDGGTTPQNAEYSALGNPNYVYVRVRNRGLTASLGTEQLKVYWSLSSTAGTNWPLNWVSYEVAPGSGIFYGDSIGTLTIPVIQAGDDTIFSMPWSPPNPAVLGTSHGCFLARIETPYPNPLNPTDPFGMTFTETNRVDSNVINNNSIIAKNIEIVDEDPGNVAVGTGNSSAQNITAGLHFIACGVPSEAFIDDGMVTIDLGKYLYDKWVKDGKQGSGFVEGKFSHMSATGILHSHSPQHFPNAPSPYSIVITGDAVLENLQYRPDERYIPLKVRFGYFVQDELGEKDFCYDLVQVNDNGTSGAVRFEIHRPDCPPVDAGSDVTIGRGCKYLLNASPIIDEATYTWFDNNTGNLIGTGSSLEVLPSQTTTYELMVTSPNGCIDFALVTVNVDLNDNSIACTPQPPAYGCFREVIVVPNPVDGNELHVRFKAGERTNITISLADIKGRVLKQDNIRVNNPGDIDHVILLNNVPVGVYKIIMKCKEQTTEISVTRF